MKRARFLLSFSLCFLLAAALPAEAWYLVAGTELDRLATISENWKNTRQNLLSTLQRSQETVERLKNSSASLGLSLQQERETTANLRQSFDVYASVQQQRLSASETKRIEAEKQRDRNSANFWKVVAALAALAAFDVLYIVIRIKKVLPI